MYILEQRSSRGTSRIRPSWPRSGHRLNPILASPYEHPSCCHAQPGVELFMTTVQVSPQCLLLSGWLLTNVLTSKHHNSVTRYGAHMYIHHTSITIHVLLYTSSILLGRLAVLHSLCPLQSMRHIQMLLAEF
jgi:hypothetical protein